MAGVSPAVIILCRRPGFRRAGMAHPARAEYPAGAFTAAQLEALTEEPWLQVLPADAHAPRKDGGAGGDAGAPSGPAAGAVTEAAPAGDGGDSEAAPPAPDAGAVPGGADPASPAPAARAPRGRAARKAGG